MSDYLDGGPQKTRETFWLHFTVGFVLGGLVAFRTFDARNRIDSVEALLLAVLASAIVTGFLAGHYLDRFWHGLSDGFRWC